MRRILAAILALLLTLSGCGRSEAKREPTEIVRQIIETKGNDPQNADRELSALFDELRDADAKQATLWVDIIDYWSDCDTMPINDNELPAGLPSGDTLGIVVLGYALNADGSMREELLGRLSAALRCAEQYPEAFLICTGGGTAAQNPQATEAGQMAAWLVEQGVSAERILVEDCSLSTVENAEYTLALIEQAQPQITDIAIVSSAYHITWGAVLFEAVSLQSAAAGGTERHVISNAAYPYINESYRDTRGYQTSGLMTLASRMK